MRQIKRFLRFWFVKGTIISNKIRTCYFHYLFKEMGHGSTIGGRIRIYYPENVVTGKNSTINEGCIFNASDSIIIGDNVHISPGVIINTGYLNYNKFGEGRVHEKKPVVIKDGAWLCSGAIINPGVTIGRNSVVAAGAVVTKDIPENVLAVGIPAVVKSKIGE